MACSVLVLLCSSSLFFPVVDVVHSKWREERVLNRVEGIEQVPPIRKGTEWGMGLESRLNPIDRQRRASKWRLLVRVGAIDKIRLFK